MKLDILSKFILLAHHPVNGRLQISGLPLNYGIVGAGLLEMSLEDLIHIEKKNLILKKGTELKNPVIKAISGTISKSGKSRSIKHWLQKLARNSHTYKWDILEKLRQKGIVRIEKKRLLGLFPYSKSYLIENRTREKLIRELREIALHGKSPSEDSQALLGLIEACKMHNLIAQDRKELKKLRKELKELLKDSQFSQAIEKTIQEVQTAIIAAIVVTTVIIPAGTR